MPKQVSEEELEAIRRVVSGFPGGASIDEISDSIEPKIHRRTLQRRLAVLVERKQQCVRLFRSLDAITDGDGTVARAWLRNGNRALGARPLDRIKTISGLSHALAYLDSRRAPL